MRGLQLIFTIMVAVSLSAFGADRRLTAGVDLLREGMRCWSPELMEQARQVCRTVPEDYQALYWRGVSEFHLLLCYGLEDSSGYAPRKAAALLDPVEQTLTAAIDLNPDDAECRAMLSAVWGFRIKMKPWTALWNGPRVLLLQGRALENGPENPRVHYIIGAGYLRAPAALRSLDKAGDYLRRAETLFAEQAVQDDLSPQWGQAACLGLLGDWYVLQGEPERAREYYRCALALNPLYVPASKGLKEIADAE